MNYSAEAKRNRRAAARKSGASNAKARQCPRCQRQNALGQRVEMDIRWTVRQCRYCGHGVGMIDGQEFGYDVTPEPGVQK